MSEAAGSLSDLRLRNRRQVLDTVRLRGTASRADIAKQTGLSNTTVWTLVNGLLEAGVLVETADRARSGGGAGRPARALTFNPAAGGVAGVHLAHDHVRAGVADLAGELVGTRLTELDVDHLPAQALDVAARTVDALIGSSGLDRSGFVGLGVAVSAPVTAGTRVVDAPRILPDWRAVDVQAELSDRLHLPVTIGNDANLGALAEHRLGAAQDVDDLVYVMLSDGVGAGLVLGGRLYEGALGGAGELGHVTVAPDGFICRCGNRGCLETVAGRRALSAALSLTRRDDPTLSDVVAAAASGDSGARRLLADAGRAVGRSLLSICTVLDPALVVIGGESAASDVLVDAVREELDRNLTPLRTTPVPVRAGSLGEDAEMLGAITLMQQQMDVA